MERRLIKLLERSRRIGTWHVDVMAQTAHWSPITYEIHEEDPHKSITVEQGIQYYVPEHRATIERCVQAAIDDGSEWDVELQILTARGNRRWVRAIGEPVIIDGQLARLHGVLEDIDGRKSLEVERERQKNELRTLTGRLSLALEASKIGVWEWDPDADELIWDAQMYRLYGIAEDTFSGAYEAWENGLHPDDRAVAAARIQATIETGERFDTTFRVQWPDGRSHTIRGIGELVASEDGKSRKLIGVNWDITDTVRAQGELQRSNEELAQFAYRSSHDLKSPLTGIRRLAHYVREDLERGQTEEAVQGLGTIEQRIQKMEALLAGILSTATANQHPQNAQPYPLGELLDDLCESVSAEAEARGVSLRVLGGHALQVRLPRTRLFQILFNLVSNGIKYASRERPERYVTLDLALSGPTLVVTVEDNGVGIPGDPERAFDMFRRLHVGADGAGLGLHIVQRHVDTLGGTIHCSSSPAGTRMRIHLPAGEAQ